MWRWPNSSIRSPRRVPLFERNAARSVNGQRDLGRAAHRLGVPDAVVILAHHLGALVAIGLDGRLRGTLAGAAADLGRNLRADGVGIEERLLDRRARLHQQ